jgi:acyl-homoserine lactone acylase PvdQ
MLSIWLVIVLAKLSIVAPSTASRETEASAADEGKTVVYRDEYGVPHIYADTVEHGIYAMAYAQAEDRLEELLKNYLRATGEMSAAFGEDNFREDLVARVWDHYGIARKNYGRIRPDMRLHLEAFSRGINDYMARHRSEVPSWWGDRRVDPYMQVAHSRQFMWGWPLGQALGDLRAAGLAPDFNVDMRSSNEWVVAPWRSSVRAPILLIDPHLSWWGAQRFWEFRIHAGNLHGSGFTLPGGMYVGLGHNDNVAWAMTTGGPDTADIYELVLNPQNSTQYKYEDAWRDLKARAIEIRVKGESHPRTVTVYESHHGPIVLKKSNKAYAAKLAYADEVQFGESFYYFNFARNVEEFKQGLALNQLMPQNVMAADTSGNIYYQRAGRVPIRPEGYDFFKPVDGSTPKTEWRGIHPAGDLYQIMNPGQGYMQNCNIAPDGMMIDSPLTADKKRDYLFGERPGWVSAHQRSARAVQILAGDASVTPEKARQYAVDNYCLDYDRWVRALREADREFGSEFKDNKDYQAALKDISAWDGHSNADSSAALKFCYWRQAVNQQLGQTAATELYSKINDFMAVLRRGKSKIEPLKPNEKKAMAQALSVGVALMRNNHGGTEAVYGDSFRVGRDDKSWPVGGGSLNAEGMATLRAIGFGMAKPDHTRWGQSGQTSTQVVVLARPIQSWTQPPIGQSDHPDSPFYRDQAEKLFSKGQMKPTWYAKQELLKHVYTREELHPAP